MRKYLTILFVCLLQNAFGQTTYYIASNGSDANNGTSTATPWQTLDKVNAASLQPNDQVLFRRGDTFYGKLIVPQSSNTVNITYGAYGSGNKPIITGFSTVSAWTNKGGNIWESTNAVSTLPDLKTVVINGVSTPMGRYPNGDASYPFLPNFFKFQSITGDGTGASSITSSSLSGGNNWTGADVVIHLNQWTLNKETITSQSGNTLNFNGTVSGLTANWGFFIQNDIRTLDQQNEWYYNPTSKKLSIYSTSQPSNVQVSTIDTLFNFNAPSATVNSVNLDSLQFQGANTHDLWISGILTFSITNCDISYSGLEGLMLYGGGIQSGTISNNTFSNNGSGAIYSTGDVEKLTITNNSINSSGIISAYKENDYTDGGMTINAPKSLVQYNIVDSSAYCGIQFKGDSIQVRNNFVNHSAMLRGDAGGIYTGYPNETGKVIDGNIVLNSMGNPRGTGSDDYFAMGIYIDDLGNNLSITNNTVQNARTAGIYLHSTNNLTVRNNTIYNCGSLAGEVMWANGGISVDGAVDSSLYGNNVNDNKVFALNQYQYDLTYYSAAGAGNAPSYFGTIDSNYYVKVNSASTAFYPTINGVNNGAISLSGWQSLTGKDAHSATTVVTDATTLRFEYNATNSNKVVTLDQKYIDVTGTQYNSGSVTIAPYSSVVLIKNGAFTVAAPIISISGDQTITVDSTSVSAVGTATSGQTITAYAWAVSSGTGTFGSPTSASTTVTGLSSGANVLRCTVTQTDGQTAYKEVTITVNFPAPTANAGTDQTITLPTSSANLSGSGTVASGQTASYLWTKVSGSGTQTITGNTTLIPTVSGMTSAGDYVFQLKVTQTDNQFATSTVTIHVNPSVTPQQPFVLFPVPIKVIQLH